MRRKTLRLYSVLLCSLCFGIEVVYAHITPPVVLLSERDAILGMMGNASRFFVRDVKLTSEERQVLQQHWGWQPEASQYRFYLGRDATGQLVTAVTLLTEFTLHGPVRVAVGLDPTGKVKDAKVIELTEETFPWIKPLLEQNLTQDYIGRDSEATFNLDERFARVHLQSMPHFYGQIVASLIQRAVLLFDITVIEREGKP
jgi:hypothetical protein